MIHPTVISFGYEVGNNNTYVAEFEWIGTRDMTPWLTWKTALEFRQNLTDNAVFAYNNNLCTQACAFVGWLVVCLFVCFFWCDMRPDTSVTMMPIQPNHSTIIY